MPTHLSYSKIVPAASAPGVDPSAVASYMLSLMSRNIATSAYALPDPTHDPPVFSLPGCVIASPSYEGYPGNVAVIDQDYVFNWTRDAAITMSEILSSPVTLIPTSAKADALADYVFFARTCQTSDPGNIACGRYTVRGQITGWSTQSDGPALRILTILQGFGAMAPDTQATAKDVFDADLAYLLGGDPPQYRQPTVTHWEDTSGQSLFARAVQLRCFRQIVATNPFGIDTTAAQAAAAWLEQQIPDHVDPANGWYVSLLAPVARQPGNPPLPQYDPSVDPIMACIYGDGIAPTDPAILLTAALVREQWTDPTKTPYPINTDDAPRGIGPLIGRYVGDSYDGDSLTSFTGHPWALCTSNLAELYYAVADAIASSGEVPSDAHSRPFFAQIGLDDPASATVGDAVNALRAAGDGMLSAVLFHSDHLELSEQFDASSGFEKSVSNLTWSYTSFLSASRVRAGQPHYV